MSNSYANARSLPTIKLNHWIYFFSLIYKFSFHGGKFYVIPHRPLGNNEYNMEMLTSEMKSITFRGEKII